MAATAEPRWSNPPPSAPTMPKLSRLGRWGRWLFKGGGPVGRAATALFDASPTAMPWFAEMPQDDFERALFAKARELEAQGVDKGEILEWFRNEGRVHAQTKAKTDERTQKKADADRKSDTVRVSATRITCYKLDKHLGKDAEYNDKFIKEFCRQLKGQESRINKMTRKEWEKGRQEYKKYGRDGSEKVYKERKRRELKNWLENHNGGDLEQAEQQAEELLKDRSPLHEPDQYHAGLSSIITRMGDLLANYIIGGEWPSRAKEFEAHARKVGPDDKMNIRLCATVKGRSVCPEIPDT